MQIKKSLSKIGLGLSMLALPVLTYAQQKRETINLIQPLDDSTPTLASSNNVFIDYFNLSSGWIFRVAVGFAVLWVLIGGVMFILSGNNQSRRSEAISRMTWSIIGLLILLFAGVILRTMNSIFFIE